MPSHFLGKPPRPMIVLCIHVIILGDPGADKWGEGKSKRAEKYIWNEEK